MFIVAPPYADGIFAAVLARCCLATVAQRTVQARIVRSDVPPYNPSGLADPRGRTAEGPNDQMASPAQSAATTSNGNALLSVRGVSVRFGGIVALDNVSFDVARGDICGLIGPNGAGKTTLFNCMSRLYQYQSGDILLEGQSLTNVPIHGIAGLGLGRTFQNLAMFQRMTVTDNIMVGAH